MSIEPSGGKTSDLAIELHPNGMLKSIRSQAKDETGAIAVAAATGLASIAATFVAGTPVAGVLARRAPTNETVCTDDTLARLLDRENAVVAIAIATDNVRQTTRALDAISAVAATVGKNLSASAQSDLQKAYADADAARAQLADRTAELVELDRQLTDVVRLRWPEDGHTFASEPLPLSASRLARWLKPEHRTDRTVSEPHSLSFTLRASAPGADARPEVTFVPSDGIRYRAPEKGVLAFCKGEVPAACAKRTDAKVVLEGPVPQLGRILVLPYKNETFQSNKLTASFTEDGRLTAGSYSDVESAGLNAASTFSSMVDLAAATAADIEAARKSEAARQTEAIQAETERLKIQAELEQARLALQPSPVADQTEKTALLQADTALLEAERAKIEAELALRAVRNRASAADGG